MDGARFDGLVRRLTRRGSRRAALGAASGSLLMLVGLDRDEAAAKSRKCRPPCPACKKCTNGRCKKIHACVRCSSDGDCAGTQTCQNGACVTCAHGTGCNGECLDLTVCPADEQHISCNNSPGCFCTRIADNNNTRFCAVSLSCDVPCGPDNSCPLGSACVTTCCDGAGDAGLRCLPSCG